MAEFSVIDRFHSREPLPQTQQTSLRPVSSTTTRAYQEPEREEDELNRHGSFLLDFDSLGSPSNSNSRFFISDEYNTSSDFGFDFNAESDSWGCEYADFLPDRNCFLCGEEGYDEPMNYVTDLFESREAHILDDPIQEFDSGPAEDTEMVFGFGPGLRSETVPLDLGVRVVGSNSESDFGEFEVNSGFIVNDEDNYDSVGVNAYRITENEREEFEWEEVNERNQFDERENFNSIIDRIGGILVSSNVPSPEGENPFLDAVEGELQEEDEEEERNVEWEVLMTVNNLDRNFSFENQEEYNNESEVARFDLPDDYTLTMEQLVENENAVQVGLPASKSVVENLPSMVLTVEEVRKNNDSVVCAVCKEDVAAGEKMTRMPCFHLYHGDCIFPWLEIKNTCPVCRYELPTDDADYEKRRRDRAGDGAARVLVDDVLAPFDVLSTFSLVFCTHSSVELMIRLTARVERKRIQENGRVDGLEEKHFPSQICTIKHGKIKKVGKQFPFPWKFYAIKQAITIL